jgi:hypothetical protein
VRDTPGVREIRDDEAGHACKKGDRFSEIPSARFLKLQEDRNASALAKLVPKRIQHAHSFLFEATEIRMAFDVIVSMTRCLRVIYEEIDELRNFKVID